MYLHTNCLLLFTKSTYVIILYLKTNSWAWLDCELRVLLVYIFVSVECFIKKTNESFCRFLSDGFLVKNNAYFVVLLEMVVPEKSKKSGSMLRNLSYQFLSVSQIRDGARLSSTIRVVQNIFESLRSTNQSRRPNSSSSWFGWPAG